MITQIVRNPGSGREHLKPSSLTKGSYVLHKDQEDLSLKDIVSMGIFDQMI